MGDWDYINEHMGGHDDDGLPNFMNEPGFSDDNYYDEVEDDTYHNSNSIEIVLTPNKYLDSESRYLRAQLINNKLTNFTLEVMHDIYNQHDSLALEVYCNKVHIGFIQKYDSHIDINKFCFNNDVLKNITLE